MKVFDFLSNPAQSLWAHLLHAVHWTQRSFDFEVEKSSRQNKQFGLSETEEFTEVLSWLFDSFFVNFVILFGINNLFGEFRTL